MESSVGRSAFRQVAKCVEQHPAASRRNYGAASLQGARLGHAIYALVGSDFFDVVFFSRPRADNVLTAAATSVTGRQP